MAEVIVKYRPHRGNLYDAMGNAKEFNCLDEMIEFIVSEWNEMGFGDLFTEDDITISDDFGTDDRIDWKETRYILIKRMGTREYDNPQCIGYCSIESK